jgi:hypothetical protein
MVAPREAKGTMVLQVTERIPGAAGCVIDGAHDVLQAVRAVHGCADVARVSPYRQNGRPSISWHPLEHLEKHMSLTRSSWRFAFSFLAAAIFVASLASCGSDLSAAPSSWNLAGVGVRDLPDTIPNSDPVIVITSGTAQTNSNGHYTFTFVGTSGGTPGTVGSDAGSWTISSSTFLFRSSTPGVGDYVAALTPASFRVDIPGLLVHSSNEAISMHFVQAP